MIACDRCGARAVILATLPTGGDLAFCGHHSHEHVDKLKASGAIIIDLTKAPASSN